MAPKRVQTGIRLSEDGARLLDRMAKDMGITRTAVIELAIRQYAKAQGYELPSDGSKE